MLDWILSVRDGWERTRNTDEPESTGEVRMCAIEIRASERSGHDDDSGAVATNRKSLALTESEIEHGFHLFQRHSAQMGG